VIVGTYAAYVSWFQKGTNPNVQLSHGSDGTHRNCSLWSNVQLSHDTHRKYNINITAGTLQFPNSVRCDRNVQLSHSTLVGRFLNHTATGGGVYLKEQRVDSVIQANGYRKCTAFRVTRNPKLGTCRLVPTLYFKASQTSPGVPSFSGALWGTPMRKHQAITRYIYTGWYLDTGSYNHVHNYSLSSQELCC